MKLIIDIPENVYKYLKQEWVKIPGDDSVINQIMHGILHGTPIEERPHGEYVDISKLRLMTVEECAGHTLDYAMGWKACVEWIKKGGAE